MSRNSDSFILSFLKLVFKLDLNEPSHYVKLKSCILWMFPICQSFILDQIVNGSKAPLCYVVIGGHAHSLPVIRQAVAENHPVLILKVAF